MKRIVIKVLAMIVLAGSMSGCATSLAKDTCRALVPLAVPVDIATAPVQMLFLPVAIAAFEY